MGLLGTSLGLALRKRGHKVSGCVRTEDSLVSLKKQGFHHIYVTNDVSMFESIHESDGIIIGTPIESVFEIIDILRKQNLSKNIWITDMASTKSDLMSWVDKLSDPLLFVGSHPMAGSDLTGPDNAKIDLFDKATIYITPATEIKENFDKGAYDQAVSDIKEFWIEVDANPYEVSYKQHDRWAAYLSHGLHLVSCMVSHLLNDISDVYDVPFNPAGGSFRDITRVAGSNPALWNGIIQSNAKEVKNYLKDLELLIKDWIFALEKGVLPVEEIFSQAAEVRSKVIKK